MRITHLYKFFFVALMLLISACGDNTQEKEMPEEVSEVNVSEEKQVATVSPVDGLPVPALEGKRIGIAAIGTEHGFDLIAYNGMIDRIEQLGGIALPFDAMRDDALGIQQIDELIELKPDAIIKMLGDHTIYDDHLKRVHDAGIPLFTLDYPSKYSISEATSDNHLIGVGLAEKMVNDMEGEGKIAVFNAHYGIEVVGIRYDMLVHVLEDYPSIEIIEPHLVDVIPGTIETAEKDVMALLEAYPEGSGLKAIWSGWDIPCIGAARAVDASGRTDIKVYGVDGDQVAVSMVADPDSSYEADMAQLPKIIGTAAVDSAARYLAGIDVARHVYVKPYLVTKDNIDEAMNVLEFE